MKFIKYSPKKFVERYTEVWGVPSESRPDKVYTIALNKKGEWSCGCLRWTMNASRPDCKHIRALKQFRDKGFQGIEETEAPERVERALTRFSAIEL